ncbi:MAG: sulfatase-like hydrolase/transferase, partial [Verrucomicrobiota bacterium]
MFSLIFATHAFAAQTAKPNIVFILADDLGYGDVRCLNPNGKIPTPSLDQLAAQGMVFTDAHSSSAVCTPTRYGLMTGRYNWRSRLKQGVQGGMSPPLIEPDRLTLPAFLQQNGYHTACIGKWHLGMDWTRKTNAPPFNDQIEKGEDGWRVDFSQPISRGPNSAGFDYFFGIAASLDMVPYAFIKNDRVTALPTRDNAFPMMLGRTNRMTRRGPAAPDFDAADVLPQLTEQAIEYIEQRASDARAGRPFFVYLPLAAPHTPIVPTPEWQGKSGLNFYADFVMQTDAAVGQVLRALERLGLDKSTLVLFASDNGCSPEAKYAELTAAGHHPSGPFRGTKADIFEGGHRVPFLVRWPTRVRAGSRSDQLVCLNDVFATCAEILNQKLPANAAEDSVSFLRALEERAPMPLREALVHHSINGSFAIRQGKWKLALCPDSGGWSDPRPGSNAAKNLPDVQLFDLSNDIGETNNVASMHPEIVSALTALLEKYVANGRSTPGAAQANTTPVDIRRPASRMVSGTAAAAPRAISPGKKSRFAASGHERPNFLFLFSDDQTFRTLGLLGELEVKTSNLDRLARRGLRFTHCFNQGGWSGAVCVPSRTMLNTGRTLWQSRGPNNTGLPENAPLWGETLGRAGYDTFMAGKWHIPDAAL